MGMLEVGVEEGHIKIPERKNWPSPLHKAPNVLHDCFRFPDMAPSHSL